MLKSGEYRPPPVRAVEIPKPHGGGTLQPSGFRRPPHTARSRSSGEVSESFVTVTHPFHPLAGQRLRVLFERRYQAGGLALCCEGGSLGTVMLPVDWTDRGTPAASGVVGFEELIELAALVRALATRQE